MNRHMTMASVLHNHNGHDGYVDKDNAEVKCSVKALFYN